MSFKLGVTTIRTENGGDPAAQSLIFSGTGKARWHGADAGLLEADHNNISSMDDDGTGDRGINLTAAMSDANYSIQMSVDDDGLNTRAQAIDTTSGTVAAGSFDFENSNFNDTNSRTDRDVTNYGSVIGDLA